MSNLSIQQLGVMLKRKRGDRGLRTVAEEVGISAATFSRVESGKQPDLDTFSKLCEWLEVNPSEILGVKVDSFAPEYTGVNTHAHLRANKELSPEVAKHLTETILYMRRYLSMDELPNQVSSEAGV